MANDRRLELSDLLHTFSENVYFQPPESLKLNFPCIVYEKSRKEKWYADNRMFKMHQVWDITYISRDPDDPIPDKLIGLCYCSFNRSFVVDNLYHTVFQLYF